MLNALMDRWGYSVQVFACCLDKILLQYFMVNHINLGEIWKLVKCPYSFQIPFVPSITSVCQHLHLSISVLSTSAIIIVCSHFLFIYSRANIWSVLSCHTLSIKKTLPSKFYLSMEAGKSDVVAATVVRSKLVFLSNGRLDRYLTVWHSDQLQATDVLPLCIPFGCSNFNMFYN